jgi:hypothetical protein
MDRAVLALLVVAGSPTAGADGGSDVRPWAGSIGLGGYAALGGPADDGVAAVAALYPGAWAGRLGLRLEARSAGRRDRLERGFFAAGLAYEAAASRPRLSLALHGEIGGLAPEPLAGLGGGVELQLWLIGPIALSLGGAAHLVADGLDSELMLSGSLAVRLAR